jgi:hypothetical protein
MSNRTIQILDADRKVIATMQAKSNAKRFSVRCAADQRQIDSLYHKGAVYASLGMSMFRFNASGRSQFLGFIQDDGRVVGFDDKEVVL